VNEFKFLEPTKTGKISGHFNPTLKISPGRLPGGNSPQLHAYNKLWSRCRRPRHLSRIITIVYIDNTKIRL